MFQFVFNRCILEVPREKEIPNGIEILKARMTKQPKGKLQEERKKMGLAFGPHFDLITEAWANSTEALCLIHPTKEIIHEAYKYVIHPSIIDASFQAKLPLKHLDGKFVPQRISRISVVQKPACLQPLYAHVKLVESEKIPTHSITLLDFHARPVMVLEKIISAEVSPDNAKVTFENAIFAFNWQQSVPETTAATNQVKSWLILGDKKGFAKRILEHIPANECVKFVEVEETAEKTRDVFAKTFDAMLSKLKDNEDLVVINFWPVDCNRYEDDTQNFDFIHSLAFENSLAISQEILKKGSYVKKIKLVFVTSGVVAMPQPKSIPVKDSHVFPWAATVFGFRRNFSEEINSPSASVVDLPSNPCDNDFYALAQDVRQANIEEEIVYRNGTRFVNRITHVNAVKRKFTKKESPVKANGEQKPFKLTSMSGKWFLQKTSGKTMKENLKIEVFFASPILHTPWNDLKTNDRIVVAGKLSCEQDKSKGQDCLVVGVCKVDDLGSYVAADRCCFTEVQYDFTAQQAASLCFPMVMSYHILTNLLTNIRGKKVLVYHESELTTCVFAYVAKSLGMDVVCLVKDPLSKDRMKQFGDLVTVFEGEVENAYVTDVGCMNLDVVCLLSKSSTSVFRQVMKHINPGASVISVYGKEKGKINSVTHDRDVHFIVTNSEIVSKSSKNLSMLLDSCCSVLKSTGSWESLMKIPQLSSCIYDMILFDDSYEKKSSDLERKTEICSETISLKPQNFPEEVSFYNLGLDSNGFKDNRTYLVIGGVRGFGFEVAKWMIENGAKTVMCTARSVPSEEKRSEVQRLAKETGSRILLRQADATSWKDMNLIKEELERLPAVAGIVFTAMILADQLINDADMKTCKKVVSTKVKGNLDTYVVIYVCLFNCPFVRVQNISKNDRFPSNRQN